MKNNRWVIIKRLLKYECDYWVRKSQYFETLRALVVIICVVITGFSDTQSFFIDENSPIPNTLNFLKDLRVTSYLAIFILVIPVIWSQPQKSKDNDEFLTIVRENIVPLLNNSSLKELASQIKQDFQIDGNLRISLWIPVRQKLLIWNLQMVCKTDNIPDKELRASFQLDEGVIGYTYLQSKRLFTLEFIDVSDPTNLPKTYKPLKPDNKLLINQDLKVVLAVAAFQKGSVVGLLAIDTDSTLDLETMKKSQLHSIIIDWIISQTEIIKILWRMKNNV